MRGSGCSIRFYDSNQKMNSRQWLFNSTGRIAAFISFAGNRNSNSTGARAFYIVPTGTEYGLSGINPTDPLYKVQTAAGAWQMNKKTGQLSAPSDCKASIGSVAAGVNSQGGFSLESCQNKLVLDVGWKVGSDPEMNKGGHSTFRDSKGNSCSVPNTSLFNYTKYDYSLKFNSSAQWANFLTGVPACRNLRGPHQSFQAGPKRSSDPSGAD